MALKSWLSSLQHTFETERALCFYTRTYPTSTCLAKIENMKEFTFMQPLISIKYFQQQLKAHYCSDDATSYTGAGTD